VTILDDSYIISTPENVQIHYSLAGLGSRFLAALIDSLLLAMLFLIIATVGLIAAFAGSGLGEAATALAIAVLVLALFTVLFGYYIVFEAVWRGQTPGKRALGLRVIREDGLPLNFTANVTRNLVRFFDLLPGTYAFGVTAMFINRRSKRLGDIAAGTVVVRDGRTAAPFALRLPPPQAVETLAPHVRGRLTEEEYALAREYLLRYSSLAPGARQTLGMELAALAETRTGVPRSHAVPATYIATVLALLSREGNRSR
jgi:uncharacterized RDD family membrane protein YckC